jgi:predicted RNA-binding Zn ribbon-like protein
VRQRAIALREAIYHIFSDTADGEEPNPHDVQTLNRELATAWDHLRLAPTGGGFAWEWVAEGNELDRVLWLVARSAAELLTSGPLDRVRECANDPCGWLFVDLSRNRSRRWCDMQDCGNKVKARRHYARTKLNGR